MKNKKAVLMVVLGGMVHMGLLAQGYPVMDISNILSSIQNGYTMVQQLQTMYNNLKTAYDQLQQQIKNFESFDFDSLDVNDPMGSWKSLTTYADRMKTYEQNIESIVKKQDIKIGNNTYSLGDIYATQTSAMKDMVMDGLANMVIDPLEKKLSPAEREIFLRKYGMSFGNYTRISQMREVLKKKAAEVVGYSGNLQKNLTEDREKLESIVGKLFGSESAVQQQQINNAVLSIMAQDMKTQANLLGNIANQFATTAAQVQIEKQALQEEINMNALGFSDGLMKMLNEMKPANIYR